MRADRALTIWFIIRSRACLTSPFRVFARYTSKLSSLLPPTRWPRTNITPLGRLRQKLSSNVSRWPTTRPNKTSPTSSGFSRRLMTCKRRIWTFPEWTRSKSTNECCESIANPSRIQMYASRGRVEVDEETNKRLKKMIDKRVLVIMICTYFLQALDKGTMSFSSIMGIKTDAHLEDGQKYSWLTTCIYIAVLIVEYPTNWIIQRVPVAKYLGINICLWGTVLAMHAACHNFAGLVTVRTLLGIFEACCQPTFVLLSSMWYKREEQAATVTYWYMMNGAQQIVGGLLAYCFTLIGGDKALKSWQALFMSYGVLSVFWGLFVIWWMPDSPMRAKCFSEEDKHLMIERLRSNQTGIQNKQFRSYQMWEAFRDPQLWCYCSIQIFTTLPTSGLGAFAGIIMTSFNFTTLQSQLLAMVLGFYIIIILLTSSWLVKKYQQNLLVMLGFVIP